MSDEDWDADLSSDELNTSGNETTPKPQTFSHQLWSPNDLSIYDDFPKKSSTTEIHEKKLKEDYHIPNIFSYSYRQIGHDINKYFFVEFDSLLIELLSSPLLDWSHGGQFLQLIYSFEKELLKLSSSGRKLIIIKFHTLSNSWKLNSHQLARKIIYQHISTNTSFIIKSFNSFKDKLFIDYLEEISPSFILISDGDFGNLLKKDNYSTYYDHLSLSLFSLNVLCVRISEIFYYSNAIFGFVITKCNRDPEEELILPKKNEIIEHLPELSQKDLDLLNSIKMFCEKEDLLNLCIIIFCCAKLYKNEKIEVEPFIKHSLILTYLPMNQRFEYEDINKMNGEDSFNFIEAFSKEALFLLEHHFCDKKLVLNVDMIDGRMLTTVLKNYKNNCYPAPTYTNIEINKQLTKIKNLLKNSLPLFTNKIQNKTIDTNKNQFYSKYINTFKSHQANIKTCAIKNIDSDLVKEVISEINENMLNLGFIKENEEKFDEINNQFTYVKDIVIRKREERKKFTKKQKKKYENYQSKFIAFMNRYSQSLSSAKIVLRDVIIANTESNDVSKEKERKKIGNKKIKGKKNKISKDDIIMKNLLKQRNRKRDQIISFISQLSKERSIELKIKKLDYKLISMGDYESAIPGLMKLLEWLKEYYDDYNEELNNKPATQLFQIIHDIFRRFNKYLSIKEILKLKEGLIMMGFKKSAESLVSNYIKFNSSKGYSNNDFEQINSFVYDDRVIRMSCQRFQMKFAGHLMVRNVNSKPDNRVSGFHPDKWQRDLLDCVDNKQSILVIAPTSSGKTFISYYAIKGVLLENKKIKNSSDKGIIVFVCPTKALVNQTAADIYKRYGRVFGISTLDYHEYALESEVLVTVPERFEKILLSPDYEKFTKKIRYVILDEIHSIGDPTGGEIWERIILMLQCPFIALSATLGNPGSFCDWLKYVQNVHNKRGEQIQGWTNKSLITHSERWSDLEKYIYLPSDPIMPIVKKIDLTKGSAYYNKSSLIHIHPLGAIKLGNMNINKNFTLPESINFSPNDCLLIYDAMNKVIKQIPEENLFKSDLIKSLSKIKPEEYFNDLCITKEEVSKYEKECKSMLMQLIKNQLFKEFKEILSIITKDLIEKIAKNEKVKVENDKIEEFEKNKEELEERNKNCEIFPLPHVNLRLYNGLYSEDYILRHFIPLMFDLNMTDDLPAIVFFSDQDLCENVALNMLHYLNKNEKYVVNKEGGKERKKNIKKKKKDQKAKKRVRDILEKVKEEDIAKFEEENKDDEPEFNEDAIDFRFSFCKPGELMDNDDIDYWMKRTLRQQSWSKSHPFIECLKKGIGIHHDGLSKAFRTLVEVLFRAKHIRIVLTTGTLALGVNMPCRTTVFAGDSPELTPLRYRQMMGRAGRRGYDNIGKVVFLAIPPKKIAYLMTSSLISLHGHFTLSLSTILRFLFTYTDANDKKFRLKSLKNLMKESFSSKSFNSKEEKEREITNMKVQIKYFYRFSLEFFNQLNLINNKGVPIKLAGIVSHIYASEPANFAFTYLLNEGEFNNICSKYSIIEEKSQESAEKIKIEKEKNKSIFIDLIKILSHIFFRLPLPNIKKKYYSSDTELAPLPQKIYTKLEKYNKTAISLYAQYCKLYTDTHLKERLIVENELPISKIKIPMKKIKTVEENRNENDISIYARSNFIRLSGHNDIYTSGKEIIDTMNINMTIMNYESVPVIEMKDSRLRDLKLNAYALNFFMHGLLSRIIKENGLTELYAWTCLKKWSLVLKSIKEALPLFIDDKKVILAFGELSDIFTAKFNSIVSQHSLSNWDYS